MDERMDLNELETRLKSIKHVDISVRLDDTTVVVDLPHFIDNHLGFARTYEPMDPNNPYKERLVRLLTLVEAGIFDRKPSGV
jgi:hypothetical protein